MFYDKFKNYKYWSLELSIKQFKELISFFVAFKTKRLSNAVNYYKDEILLLTIFAYLKWVKFSIISYKLVISFSSKFKLT